MASNNGFNGYAAKTADHTVLESENGTTFTNRGAVGAVVLTLPAPFAGGKYRALVHAAQNFSFATATADTFVLDNDATGDSLLCSRIGGCIDVECDGTSWFGRVLALATNATVGT
jgi:arginine/ornithine N-succinyltransferase beta subunit